jgi:tetratricopeptide (TPR) repeat protein
MVAFKHNGMTNPFLILQEQTEQLNLNRTQKSEGFYQKGLEYLKNAAQSDFTDKEELKKATRAFLKALQFNPSHTDSLTKLSYIYNAYGQKKAALYCLNQIKSADPNHAEISSLITHIMQDSAQPESSQQQTQTKPSDSLENADVLYAEIEKMLIEDSQILANDKFILDLPSADNHQYNLQKIHFSSLQNKYKLIQTQIDILAQDFDVLNLNKYLHIYEMALQRLKIRMVLSQKLIALSEYIDELIYLIQEDLSNTQDLLANEKLSEFEAKLEDLLNQGDFIADRLDELDSEGTSISQVEPKYNQLVGLLEELSEKPDLAE